MAEFERGLHVIDGSHLFSSILTVWRQHPELKDHKLKVDVLSSVLGQKWGNYTGSVVRVIYYFMRDDKRLKTLVEIPDPTTPNAKSHWRINECAQPNKALPKSELKKIDQKYHDHIHRGEKGLDMELACDTLSAVASGRINTVNFLVNDGDYIPLFHAVQRLGGNTYLTGLDIRQAIHKELAALCDLYQTCESELNRIFGYTPPAEPIETDNSNA